MPDPNTTSQTTAQSQSSARPAERAPDRAAPAEIQQKDVTLDVRASGIDPKESQRFRDFAKAHTAEISKIHSLSEESRSLNSGRAYGKDSANAVIDKKQAELFTQEKAITDKLKPAVAEMLGLSPDKANGMTLLAISTTFTKADGTSIPALSIEVSSRTGHTYATQTWGMDGELLYSSSKDFKRFNQGIDSLAAAGQTHVDAIRQTSPSVHASIPGLQKELSAAFADLLKPGETIGLRVNEPRARDVGVSASVDVFADGKEFGPSGYTATRVPLGSFVVDLKSGKVGYAAMEGVSHERVISKTASLSRF